MASGVLTNSGITSSSHSRNNSTNSLGAGSPFKTTSSIPRSQSSDSPRPALKRRASNNINTSPPAGTTPSGRSSPTRPSSSSSSPAPLRRSLSFKVPIRVSTDSAKFPSSSSQTRSRAQSLPQQPESSSNSPSTGKRQNPKRFSLVSIGEFTPTQVPPSPTPSNKSLESQFLLDRGLIIPSEGVDESKSPEQLQSSLQERVVKYLTTMSAPTKSSPDMDRAPASYPPAMYQGGNMGDNRSLTAAGGPMPGLSGPPNGPIGNLLRGAVNEDGKLKDAGLMVGIKLDLEAEVHLTARIRGDILVGLY